MPHPQGCRQPTNSERRRRGVGAGLLLVAKLGQRTLLQLLFTIRFERRGDPKPLGSRGPARDRLSISVEPQRKRGPWPPVITALQVRISHLESVSLEQLGRVEGALGVPQGKAQLRGIAELFQGVATQIFPPTIVPRRLGFEGNAGKPEPARGRCIRLSSSRPTFGPAGPTHPVRSCP
jgi:hypothetical protein